MGVTASSVDLKLVSGPYRARVGLLPMVVALSLGLLFVIIWLAVAVFVFQYNPWWSILLGLSTIVFAVYLGLMALRLIADAFREYVLELTDAEAVLSVTDHLKKKRSTKMVLLDDVKYVEYYPFQDSASIILHAPYTDMEVPLWPLGIHGQDVVDFLNGRGVPVVNVQSDDPIPE